MVAGRWLLIPRTFACKSNPIDDQIGRGCGGRRSLSAGGPNGHGDDRYPPFGQAVKGQLTTPVLPFGAGHWLTDC